MFYSDESTTAGESFPVKRRLLRPCVALTPLVQAGRGKYRHCTVSAATNAVSEPNSQAAVQILDAFSARVNMDACTFDRVLLYLEHEVRGFAS
jgi:hypothetical protein